MKNDNNKNRQYETMDDRVRETYTADSKSQLKNKLYDPYIKAIRWASDRIGQEGIVAFVTNNGFLDGRAFDGLRKNLAKDFDAIYILDLGGNARRGLKISDSNAFGIQVGVSINFFVKTRRNQPGTTRIFYYRTNELWDKKRKFEFLVENHGLETIEWRTIQPNVNYTWLTDGLQSEFETFIPISTKEAKVATGDVRDVIF